MFLTVPVFIENYHCTRQNTEKVLMKILEIKATRATLFTFGSPSLLYHSYVTFYQFSSEYCLKMLIFVSINGEITT